MEHLLIIPMTVYALYILLLGVYNFIIRRGAIRSGQLKLDQFKSYTSPLPEHVIVTGRHFDNQFQAPMLFLIVGVAHMAMKDVDRLTLTLAWAFVATRLMHSFEHLGPNRVLRRAALYGCGLSLIAGLWIQLALYAL